MAEIVKESEDQAPYGQIKKVSIEMDGHHALNLLSFLVEFDLDTRQEFSYLKRSVQQYKEEVFKKCHTEHVDDAEIQIKLETMLGNAPNENKNGNKIV